MWTTACIPNKTKGTCNTRSFHAYYDMKRIGIRIKTILWEHTLKPPKNGGVPIGYAQGSAPA